MSRDYAVMPGEFLREWIEEEGHGLTQGAVAERLGVSRKTVNEILNGKAPITDDMAIRLERVTQIPRDAWMRYEALYRADRARVADESSLAEHARSTISRDLGQFLRQHGVTESTMRDPGRLMSDFLGFVRCGSFDAFESAGRALCSSCCVSTLKESSSKLDPAAFMAWLEVGSRTDEFASGYGMSYSEEKLRRVVPDLKRRASTPDEGMLFDLGKMLSQSGVVLVFVNPPAGFPLHGITRWLQNGVPVVQLTGRRLTDGFVVWALFHEIGHVLNDDRRQVGAKTKAQIDEEEKRANAFAYDALFGTSGLDLLKEARTDRQISDAAASLGISPGLAVTVMHKRRWLPYNAGNGLSVNVMADAN